MGVSVTIPYSLTIVFKSVSKIITNLGPYTKTLLALYSYLTEDNIFSYFDAVKFIIVI